LLRLPDVSLLGQPLSLFWMIWSLSNDVLIIHCNIFSVNY
jgi:hypothetical protein